MRTDVPVAQAFLPVCIASNRVNTDKNVCATGSALLAVLWLTAALSAIAFTVASNVRAETERTSTDADALRTYYLATGAIDRALLYIQWGSGYRNPDGKAKYFENPMPVLRFDFPTGFALVDVVPETAKLNINTSLPDELGRLMLALGIPPEAAQQIVQGIVDWRSPSPGGSFTQFDQHYLALTPSFRSRHASFQEIEELLLVQGVTPDLFYPSYSEDAEGRLTPRSGLRDCLSVYGSVGSVDVNTAEAAVMEAIGVSAGTAMAIVASRRTLPIRSQDQLSAFGDGSPGFARLRIEPSSIATLRATARLRLANGQVSDLRRSVSAMVKFLGPEWNPPYHVMRWYDNATSLQ